MSGIEQQKTINSGGKQTGKIFGGMFFNGNTTQATTVVQNTWTRIGAGNASAPLFALVPIQPISAPSTSGVNDYFSLNTGTTAATQALWYRYGKRAVLTLSYSLTVINTVAMAAGVDASVRVSSISSDGVTTTNYTQSVKAFRAAATLTAVSHSIPIVAPTGDAFYLEVFTAGAELTWRFADAYLQLSE